MHTAAPNDAAENKILYVTRRDVTLRMLEVSDVCKSAGRLTPYRLPRLTSPVNA